MLTQEKTNKKLENERSFISLLENKGMIAAIDREVADYLIHNQYDGNERVRPFLIHLSLASRKGHLCATADYPKARHLWIEPAGDSLPDETWDDLEKMIAESSRCLGNEVREGRDQPICSHAQSFYFQKHWDIESGVISGFLNMIQGSAGYPLDQKEIAEVFQDFPSLLPEQKEAIQLAARSSFSLICGGPGTGKTYTVGVFLAVLERLYLGKIKAVISAPTGKAAAHLKESILKTHKSAFTESIDAKTLHSLLKIGRRIEEEKLSYDLIIVDESSMIDASLMNELFAKIRKGSRLVLVGDPFQLPPVEAGSLFGDLVEALQGTCWQAARLTKCLRTESKAILEIASAINEGDSGKVLEAVEPIHFLLDSRQAMEELLGKMEKYYDYQGMKADEALQKVHEFRLLCPLRKGLFGVDNLNTRMADRLKSRLYPILITGNDPDMDLYNGELGILVKEERPYALFKGKGGVVRKLPEVALPSYELAFAMTVHKSQGSEFDQVILLMPSGSEVFGRKVLYTGATRAKKKLEIWSDRGMIEKTMNLNFPRMSGLAGRIKACI